MQFLPVCSETIDFYLEKHSFNISRNHTSQLKVLPTAPGRQGIYL